MSVRNRVRTGAGLLDYWQDRFKNESGSREIFEGVRERWELFTDQFGFGKIIEERDLSQSSREGASDENPSVAAEHPTEFVRTSEPILNVVVDVGDQGRVEGVRFEGKLFRAAADVRSLRAPPIDRRDPAHSGRRLNADDHYAEPLRK